MIKVAFLISKKVKVEVNKEQMYARCRSDRDEHFVVKIVISEG